MIFYPLVQEIDAMGRTKKIGDDELLEAIALSPDPVVTAPELAEKLDYSTDGVRNRLRNLEDEGKVKSRDVGARATIWWMTPRGRQSLS